jgi:hypothetical protein
MFAFEGHNCPSCSLPLQTPPNVLDRVQFKKKKINKEEKGMQKKQDSKKYKSRCGE